MNRWRTLLAIAGVSAAAVAIIAAPSSALAHARWKSSTPGKGEVVQISPAQVVIEFSQDVQKVSGTYAIAVAKDRGPDVTSGPTVLDDTDRAKMSVPLQPNLPPGRYVVNYKNVSDADGDANAGAFAFYIQVQPTTVDLANDAQLATLDPTEPQTPGPDTTPGSGSTPNGGTTPATTAAAPTTGGATAVATATAQSTTDSGGSNTGRNIAIAVVIVVAIVVLAGGGWYAFGRPRR